MPFCRAAIKSSHVIEHISFLNAPKTPLPSLPLRGLPIM